jgi:acyl-CoA reductase-like NAD-dependent aldehyde dehydrogenase
MQLRQALERNKERLRRIVVTEVGCPISVTGSQIESHCGGEALGRAQCRTFEYLRDTGIHQASMGTARRTLAFDPVGVVGAITPWNVPFYLNVAEHAGADGGNTVVLKPAQPGRAPNSAGSSPRRPTSRPGCSTSWCPMPTRWARR